MIQPLRSLHRTVFSILAGLLPLLILAGLLVRHPEHITNRVKPSFTGSPIISRKHLVSLQVVSGTLTAVAGDGFNYPETLVYISGSEVVDANSRLLGRLNPQIANFYKLPVPDATQQVVVFYSPALSTIVDTADLAGVR
jgi:hypothetical protein